MIQEDKDTLKNYAEGHRQPYDEPVISVPLRLMLNAHASTCDTNPDLAEILEELLVKAFANLEEDWTK